MTRGSRGLAVAAAMAFATGAAAQPAPRAPDPDWPCVQVLVPELSPGQVWPGPPIDEIEPKWASDPRVAGLGKLAVGRATPVAELEASVERLAQEAGPEKDAALTALFAGVFDAVEQRRSRAIEAIKRYARQQRELQGEIAESLRMLDAAPRNSPEAARIADVLGIQRRVLDDRRRSLTAICDQPVDAERRLGEVSRVIAAYLD